VNDEDLIRKVAREGKVRINGQEFSIRPPKKPIHEALDFGSEYQGTFSNEPNYANPDRVNAPAFPIQTNPFIKITPLDFHKSLLVSKSARDQGFDFGNRPEVALLEGIRAALRGGVSSERIKEIFNLELVTQIMDS